MKSIQNKIKSLAEIFFKDTVQIRQHLHAYPELSFKEYITPELVLILIFIFSFLLVSKFKFISLKFSNFNFIKNLDRYIIILISFPTLYIYKDSYLFLLILFYVIYSVIKSFFSKLFFK